MSPKILLYDGSPLVISPSLAKRFGVNEALVLQQIHYWMNPSFNKNIFEGKYWVHNTYTQWQKQFPFWNLKKIRRLFNALEDLGILLSFTTCQNFSKVKYYSIDYRKIYEGQEIDLGEETEEAPISTPWVNRDISNSPKMAHGYTQNGPTDAPILEQTEAFALKNRAEKAPEHQENKDFAPGAKNGHIDGPDMGTASTQNGLIDAPVLEKAKAFDVKNRSEEVAEPKENKDFAPGAKNGHIDGPDMGYGSAQKWPMEVPKSGLSYKDTEITKKDISFLPPLTPPSLSNFGKKEGIDFFRNSKVKLPVINACN